MCSLQTTFPRNVADVAAVDLCTGCGACTVACPNGAVSLALDTIYGLIRPHIDNSRCNGCRRCISVCPGWDLDDVCLPSRHETNETTYGVSADHGLFCAFSTDANIRYHGASGGILTAMLAYMLEMGTISGAFVSRMKPNSGLQTETFVARTEDDLRSAQGSLYCPVPACTALSLLTDCEETLAFVGLPCQVAALRRLQLTEKIIAERVRYAFSLFCSRTPNLHATYILLYRLGITPESVCSIKYRGHGHPGRMKITLRDGSERFVNHKDRIYWGGAFLDFFKPYRCWLCPDHSGALADASFADDWKSSFTIDGKGSSTIVCRHAEIREYLSEMAKKKRIVLAAEPLSRVVESHKLPKKSRVRPRIVLSRFFGLSVPSYARRLRGECGVVMLFAEALDLMRVVWTRQRRSPRLMTAFLDVRDMLFRGRAITIRVARILQRMPGRLRRGMHLLGRVEGPSPEPRARHKIVMIGGFGHKDMGDEAMPHADIINLRKRVPDLDIVLVSPNPEYSRESLGERAILDLKNMGWPRKVDLKSKLRCIGASTLLLLAALSRRFGYRMRTWAEALTFLDELEDADLLFNVGGGNLNSIMPGSLHTKSLMYLTARTLKVPVVVSGQTIGPIDNRLDAIIARIGLNMVQMITLRDKDISSNRLRKLGIRPSLFEDAADDAMTLPSADRVLVDDVLRRHVPEVWLNGSVPLVAMNFKGSLVMYKGAGRSGNVGNELSVLAGVADRLIREYGVRVILVPTTFSRNGDDRVHHRIILDRMELCDNARAIEEELTDTVIKGIVGKMHAAIGARYHFNVFAAACRVPFLGMASGVYQMTKLRGLAALCGLPECFFEEDLEYVELRSVWNRVSSFMDGRERIAKRLVAVAPVLEEKSLLCVERALVLLKKSITPVARS